MTVNKLMNFLTPILATVSGKEVVSAVIWTIGLGLIFWLLWWLVDFAKIPEPFNRIAKVIVAVAAVVLLINLIMSVFGGEPFIKW